MGALQANINAIANVLTVIRTGEKAIRAAERAIAKARSEDKFIARLNLAALEKRVQQRVIAAQTKAHKVLCAAV
jgi:alpha-D-ribose 1-methylphosphonate 5-triphosphate synthase subunit PhnI